MKTLNILMIDDMEADFLLVRRHIHQSVLDAELHWAKNAGGLSAALDGGGWDVVLSDYNVPGLDFVETLDLIRKRLPDIPIILVSGSIGEETAVELLKNGLCDFVLKDRLHRLVSSIERCLNVVADKRKREEAERKLAKNEQLMRAVLDGTSDAIFVKDRQGRYLLVNNAAARFVGHSAEEIIGRDDSFLFQPEIAEKIMARDQMVMDQSMVQSGEEWITTKKDDHIAFLVSRGPVFDQDGKVDGTFGVAMDITGRKQAEEEQKKLQAQLYQAQKMESVGLLAGGVAHDYNNMLSVIMGYSEMAMSRVPEDDPLHADLREILDAARRSTEITRQLLAFARKQPICPELLDLNETIEMILKMLRRLIGEDITLAWLPESELWTVKMDSSQIDQILANLCINARDAIGGVGKIIIETKNITIDEARDAGCYELVPGHYAMLAVSDDGSGMDKKTLDRVFEPFFTTKRLGKGTGLGLATVYGIVKQNNGFINVYSEPGQGTTFRIYIPRHEGVAGELSTGKAPAIPLGRGQKVLLVEDEQAIRRLGEAILKKLGYQVVATSMPDEAIRLAQENEGGIDLLLTDVVMPGMSGHQLADQLHAIYPEIKILYMSGYTSDVISHRGVLPSGVNFIHKPFTQRDLAVKLHEVLG